MQPLVKNHQSSVPGIFLAGSVIGSPLIKTSAADAVKAIEIIKNYLNSLNKSSLPEYDLIICGGGVAGISAAIKAEELNLHYLVLEKDKICQTIHSFPEGKTIYANPQNNDIEIPYKIIDCSKKSFLNEINSILKSKHINFSEREEVVNIEKIDDNFQITTKNNKSYHTKSVLLALGQRGNPRKLNIKGENSEHVFHELFAPGHYKDKNIVIIGGGNSAVEAAIALYEHGAHVTLSYRKDSFYRPSATNRKQINQLINTNKIKVFFNSKPTQINSESIELDQDKTNIKVSTENVFILTGTEPPNKLLSKFGVKFENKWNLTRFLNLCIVFMAVWIFYAFFKWDQGNTIIEFPFNMIGNKSSYIPVIYTGIIKGAIYSLVVLIFAIIAIRRWVTNPNNPKYQLWKYISLIISQTIFLFVLPEFIITKLDPSNGWRFYGFMLPFPLVYSSFFNSTMFWIIICALSTFVIIPIFVYWHGKKFCSWICGCGALAETLGDRFRHYSPKNKKANTIEQYLLWTMLTWACLSAGYYIFILGNTGQYTIFMRAYFLIADFYLASVIGVSFYFFYGPRIWCRFFCPLAHYMRLLSALYSKFKISSKDKCIACEECNRYCQMGIDVMQFSLKEEEINNKNSNCVGCGICISVCPMENLILGDNEKK